MKTIFTTLLLFLCLSVFAQVAPDTVFITVENSNFDFRGGPHNALRSRQQKCVLTEKFSAWVDDKSNQKVNNEHEHNWVHAEFEDVNYVNTVSNLAKIATCGGCPCGSIENQARICSICLLQQSRVKEKSYIPNVYQSAYKKLLVSKIKKPVK